MNPLARLARSWRRSRAASLQARMDALETQYAQAWGQYLPGFLNAISSVGALGFEVSQLRAAQERQTQIPTASAPKAAGRILVPHIPQTGLRLHLGAGAAPVGHLRVREAEEDADIVAAPDGLPLPAGAADAILAAHVLQHIPAPAPVLAHWKTLLAPGGVLTVILPDGEALFGALARGEYGFTEFRDACLGPHGLGVDIRTPEQVIALLEKAGFADVAIAARARRNGPQYEFEARARRP